MARITWDRVSERRYETGIEHGVLYTPTSHGVYGGGVPWNGLVSVSENPDGAEPNDQYADNIKYLTIVSAENFKGTIEAFTYPPEFEECDGTLEIAAGVTIGQQDRKAFGLCYKTIVGNDVDGLEHGYKLHLLYGLMASPSEKPYETMNDSPEAITFSWDITSIPAPVTGHKPTSVVTINSLKCDPARLEQLQSILYGDSGDPRLPTPDELAEMFANNAEGASFLSARQAARMRAGEDMASVTSITKV